MKLSIVTTLYNSSPYIDEFYGRICAAANVVVKDDYEIIFVNDGSPDDSLQKAIALTAADNVVKIVDLSRNFGHHKAMMAGLEYASGDLVFLIDSDLEEKPEWFLEFYDKLEADVFPLVDVVYGVQTKRKGKWFERISGELFFWGFRKISMTDVPRNIVTTRLMRNRYVRALISHREREYFIAGLWAITGFRQEAVQIKKVSSSPSNYSLFQKLSITLRSVLSFSAAPLRFLCLFGFTIASLSGAYALYLIIRQLFFDSASPGWASVMVSVWILGGLIILSIGIIGLYIDKIFSEVKQRPNHIVRELIGFKDNE